MVKDDLVCRVNRLYLIQVPMKPLICKLPWRCPLQLRVLVLVYLLESLLEHSRKSPSTSTTIIFGSPNGTNNFPKFHCADWYDVISFTQCLILAQILSYNSEMWGYCKIHPDLVCPLFPKIPGIPHQMEYLTQLYESTVVFHERMNLPIDNLCRLLWNVSPPYWPLATKTMPVPWVRLYAHGCSFLMEILGMLISPLVWTLQVPLSYLVV